MARCSSVSGLASTRLVLLCPTLSISSLTTPTGRGARADLACRPTNQPTDYYHSLIECQPRLCFNSPDSRVSTDMRGPRVSMDMRGDP